MYEKKKEEVCQVIDEEFFETKDDKYIDNLEGEEGVGNDISEFIIDNNGTLEKVQEMDEQEIANDEREEVLEIEVEETLHDVEELLQEGNEVEELKKKTFRILCFRKGFKS